MITPTVSAGRSVINAVGTTSKSTSGLELWGFNFPIFRIFDPILGQKYTSSFGESSAIEGGYGPLQTLKF